MTTAQWLKREPFTLVLSAGFFGFYAHAGFLLALDELGLCPARVLGSSAGALVGGMFAAGRSPAAIQQTLLELRRKTFWDPWPGPGLLRGKLFQEKLEELLPSDRFETCPIPLALSVFDLHTRRTRVVESGQVSTAIRASCAIPLLFWPVSLQGHLCYDGAMLDRSAHAGLHPGERVLYHHLEFESWSGPPYDGLLDVPARVDRVTICTLDLPLVGPFQLQRGPGILERCRATTRRALLRPVAPLLLENA